MRSVLACGVTLLQVLPTVLDNTPFAFAIDLAALASRREYLNLEKWLQDAANLHRGPFLEVRPR
jgi:CCR4-NOT transcription complex subunit 1